MTTTLANTTSLDDGLLVARLIDGSEVAWREFNTAYSRLVYRCISRVLERFSRSAGDVDEVYATFCLELLRNDCRKLRTFAPERGNRLTTWLGLLATHCAYDHLRRQRRRLVDDEQPVSETLCALEPDPLCQAESRQEARRVLDAMTQLSEKDRQFVELFFGDGHSPEEVAEMMGISVKTVYSKKHKIRARLEAALRDTAVAA